MFEFIWEMIKGIFKLGFILGVIAVVIILIGVFFIKSLF